VKSIRYGNLDVTHRELDTAEEAGSLEMVLSVRAADIAGTVLDEMGKPVTGTSVTLWMPGLASGAPDRATTTRTDAAGRFKFGRLAPGEYRLAAWESIGASAANPNLPSFHGQFDTVASAIQLAEGSHETVQPAFIGAARVQAAMAKMR
jgi:hypothetical protein